MRCVVILAALSSIAGGQTVLSLASLSTGVDEQGRVWGKAIVRVPDGRGFTVLRRAFSAEELQGPASDVRPVRKVYRDSAGRTRVERLVLQGEEPGALLIELNDPASGVAYILDVQRRTAHRLRYPPAGRLNVQPIVGPGQAPAVKGVVPRVTEEALGSMVIEGVPAEGQRFTTTIPPGPDVRVEEIWTSPGLWLTLRRTIRDPRDGDTVFQVTNISREEPEASLFEPPVGYRVVGATSPFELAIGEAPDLGKEPEVVYRPGNGVSPPRPISRPEPKYTEEARRAGISGTVGLECVIGVDGVPRDIRVLLSLDPGLDRSAVEAVSTWQFEPAMLNGKAVPVRVRIDTSFRMGRGPGPAGVGTGTPGAPGKTMPRTDTKRFPVPVK